MDQRKTDGTIEIQIFLCQLISMDHYPILKIVLSYLKQRVQSVLYFRFFPVQLQHSFVVILLTLSFWLIRKSHYNCI